MTSKEVVAKLESLPHGLAKSFTRRAHSRVSTRSQKLRIDKTSRLKEELRVMILLSDGNSELYSMTRPEILEQCRQAAHDLRIRPFGEMRMKDLRMLDPNVSFGSEPKILVRTLCVMVSLNPVHAFILPDKVLLLVHDGADGILFSLKTNLKTIIQANFDVESSAAPSQGDDDDDYDLGNHFGDIDAESDKAIRKPSKGLEQIETTTSKVASFDGLNEDENAKSLSKVGSPLPRFPIQGHRSDSVSSVPTKLKLKRKSLLRTRSYDSEDATPFQYVAMELIFDAVALSFKKEVDLLRFSRDEIRTIINANEVLSKANSLRSRVIATRDAVEDFIADDKDVGMCSFDSIYDFYGTDTENPESDTDNWIPFEMDVNEAEELAEDFVSRMDDAVNEIDMIKFTLEEIMANLTHQAEMRRERLLKCHIRIQGATCMAALPTLVAGLFGMNMYSGLMPDDDFSVTNFWVTFAVCVFLFFGGLLVFIYLTNRFFIDTDLSGAD